jgi:ATPase subunit of ABC transporter with duplicated ATPase domains
VTNLTCEVGGGGIRMFEGNYDYYTWKKESESSNKPENKKQRTPSKGKLDYQERKKIQNRLSWIKRRFKSIEKELEKHRAVTLNPENVDDYEKLQKAMETMTVLEAEYLGLMEEQESLQ